MTLLNRTNTESLSQNQHSSHSFAVASESENQTATPLNALRLIDNIVQKLRTEVNAMIGFSQMVLPINVEQQQAQNMVGQLGQSLIGFIDVVKIHWQIETKSYPISPKRFRLNSLLDAIQAEVQPQAMAKGLSLQISKDPSLPEFLQTDPNCLRQALATLLNDTMSRRQTGQIRCHVSLFLKNLKNHVCFEIDDFKLPAYVTGQHDPYQWCWENFDADIDMARLNVVLAARKIRLLGGSVVLVCPPKRKGILTIDCPLQCPEMAQPTHPSNRSDQILSQIAKNYSATRRDKHTGSRKSGTDYSNSENYLG